MLHFLVGEPCRGGLESLVGSKWEAPGGGGWLWACQDGVAEGYWPGEQEYLCSPPQMGQPHRARKWCQAFGIAACGPRGSPMDLRRQKHREGE